MADVVSGREVRGVFDLSSWWGSFFLVPPPSHRSLTIEGYKEYILERDGNCY